MKLERLIGWGEDSSHQEEEDEGWIQENESKDLRMDTKPAGNEKKQTKLPMTWSILPIDIGGASVTSSQEEDQPSQVVAKKDPLPSGMEQFSKTINASGDGMEERSIHLLTGSLSNNVEGTHERNERYQMMSNSQDCREEHRW